MPASKCSVARLPVCAQLAIELFPTLLGKEDAGALQLEAPARSRDRLCEPLRPFHIEVDIVRPPYDQRGCFQSLEAVLDADGLGIVESSEKALELQCALLGAHERPEIRFDALIGHPLRMLVRRTERLRRAIH